MWVCHVWPNEAGTNRIMDAGKPNVVWADDPRVKVVDGVTPTLLSLAASFSRYMIIILSKRLHTMTGCVVSISFFTHCRFFLHFRQATNRNTSFFHACTPHTWKGEKRNTEYERLPASSLSNSLETKSVEEACPHQARQTPPLPSSSLQRHSRPRLNVSP